MKAFHLVMGFVFSSALCFATPRDFRALLELPLSESLLSVEIGGDSSLSPAAETAEENCQELSGSWSGGCDLTAVGSGGPLTDSQALSIEFRKVGAGCHIVMDWRLGTSPLTHSVLNLGKIKTTTSVEGPDANTLHSSYVWNKEAKTLGFTYSLALMNATTGNRLSLAMSGLSDLTFRNSVMATWDGTASAHAIFGETGKPGFRRNEKTLDWHCSIYRKP